MDIIGRQCFKWRLRIWLKLLWHEPVVDMIGRQFSRWRLAQVVMSQAISGHNR